MAARACQVAFTSNVRPVFPRSDHNAIIGQAIFLARFVPIIRTFAPFLAGVAGMPYRRFLCFNVIGAVLWITSLTYAGYLFGNIPWVRGNITAITLGVIAVSLLPLVYAFVKSRLERKNATAAAK